MKKNGKKRLSVGKGTLIGAGIAALVIIFLLNPDWLPVSETTKAKIVELEKANFLIERSAHLTLAHWLTLLLAVCVVWLLYTLGKLLLATVGKKNVRARTITSMFIGGLKYLAVIAGVVWGLRILGINATAILAGIGIIGLILGFGAQSLIEDVITGLFIIFEGKYSIGDIIVLDDFRGVVRDIGVRTTTIEDAGYNLKVVNNSDIRNFQNRSRKLSLALCEVSVAYDTDLRKLEKILAENLPLMLEPHHDLYVTAPRYLGVQELGDSGVVIKIVADVKEENIFAAQRMLNRDIRVLFADKNVEIPFPQVDVHQK